MRTSMASGYTGVQSLFTSTDRNKWVVPMVLYLSGAFVIGLLFFGLNQRTETKLLKMQYMVEDVKTEADANVRDAQRELFAMTQKYQAVKTDIQQLQTQLAQLEKEPGEDRQNKKLEKKNTRIKRIKTSPQDRGLENLTFGKDTHLSSAKDDPTVGFGKGELM